MTTTWRIQHIQRKVETLSVIHRATGTISSAPKLPLYENRPSPKNALSLKLPRTRYRASAAACLSTTFKELLYEQDPEQPYKAEDFTCIVYDQSQTQV